MKRINKQHVDKAKVYGAKVAAAYATYEKSKKTINKFADAKFHVYKIDSDYAPPFLYNAAHEVTLEQLPRLPWKAEVDTIGERYLGSSPRFEEKKWTWLPIAGVSRQLAVRVNPNDSAIIEFRSPLKRDIARLKAVIEERQAKLDEESGDFEIDVEIRRSTSIFAWGNGEWDYRKDRLARTFGSVMLPADLQEAIQSDLEQFTQSRERLRRLEMPWRRGYMLSGPPGTGKTSLSMAIAGSLNFGLASLSLTDVESDGELRKAISCLPRNTVLVIEDIDAYAVSRDRDHNAATDGKFSLSGLLNSMDGFETPDGMVTIVTTNHADHLDPALIRSGRIDRDFHLGYIEARELERLFQWFYEEEAPYAAPTDTGSAGLAPAEAAELFKQHLNDPQGGWDAVCEFIYDATRPTAALHAA